METKELEVKYIIPNKPIKGSVKINESALNGVIQSIIERADFLLEEIIYNMLSLNNRFTIFSLNNDNMKRIIAKTKRNKEREVVLAEILRNGGSICVSDENNKHAEIRIININDYYKAFVQFSGLYPNSYQAILFNEDSNEDYEKIINLLLYGK